MKCERETECARWTCTHTNTTTGRRHRQTSCEKKSVSGNVKTTEPVDPSLRSWLFSVSRHAIVYM